MKVSTGVDCQSFLKQVGRAAALFHSSLLLERDSVRLVFEMLLLFVVGLGWWKGQG